MFRGLDQFPRTQRGAPFQGAMPPWDLLHSHRRIENDSGNLSCYETKCGEASLAGAAFLDASLCRARASRPPWPTDCRRYVRPDSRRGPSARCDVAQGCPGAGDHRVETDQPSPESDHAGFTVALSSDKTAESRHHVDGGL